MSLLLLTTPGTAQPLPQRIETPGLSPSGLAWDGSHLWLSDSEARRLFTFDLITLEWQARFDWNGTPGPIAWDGVGLWVVDEGARALVRVDPASGSADPTGRIPLPDQILEPPHSISGLTWAEGSLWLCRGSGLCASYYQIDPDSGGILQSFFPRCSPRGLAWDGTYLWTLAYNGPSSPPRLSRRRLDPDRGYSALPQELLSITAVDDPRALVVAEGHLWTADRRGGFIMSIPIP